MPVVSRATPRRRRARALIAVGCAMGALTACGTSFDAQTNAVYDPGVGTNARGGGVDVLNALIVDNGDGTGTLSATAVLNPGELDDQAEGSDVPAVTMDELRVTTLEGELVDSTLVDEGVRLEPNQPVQLGEEPAAWVSGDTVAAGSIVTLSIGFDAIAEPVELEVPVVVRTEMYDDVAVPAQPT